MNTSVARRRQIRFPLLLCALLFGVLLPSPASGGSDVPVAVDGSIEVRRTNLSETLRLIGERQFYPNALLAPDSILGRTQSAYERTMPSSLRPDHRKIFGTAAFAAETLVGPTYSRERDWFIIGALLLVGLYHSGLHVFGSVERSTLWFGLSSVLMATRTLAIVTANLLEPSSVFGFELLMTVEYVALFLWPAFFLYYGCSMFPSESRIRIAHAVAVVSGAFATVALLTPAGLFTRLLDVYQPIPVLIGAYLIAVGANAARYRRPGARVFLAGMIVLFATLVNDLLFSLTLVQTGYMSHIGFFIFLFIQLFLLAGRFSENYRQTQLIVEEKLQLEGLSYRDALTGIGNRRHFDTYLSNECSRAHRSGSPISLVIIDIDHFKLFNDTFGHQLGDEVLVRVAGRVAQALRRPGDQCARYGGEEFAIILPDTNSEGVRLVAQRLRVDIAKIEPPEPGEPSDVPPASQAPLRITASLGVATIYWGLDNSPDVDDAPRKLIEMADRALYLAKERGRNRVVVDRM
ncbi:MAG: diguanylate cyclase [Spirochaetales bacterium]